MGKQALIVFGHPDHNSLNGAMLNTAIGALEKQGHEVTVTDLCKMNFDPVLGRHDIIDPSPNSCKWSDEWPRACKEGRIAQYIKDERSKLMAADLVIFQFPMYYLGLPAIVKGWIDKVCSEWFAYEIPDKIMDNGCFKGKKAMLSFTTIAPASVYSSKGMHGEMDATLWPLSNCLRFFGFDVLPPNIAYSIRTEEEGKEFLATWSKRLEDVFEEKPLFFFPLADHSLDGELKPEVVDRAVSRGDTGPNIGQHLGLRVPEGSMRRRISF